MALRVTRLQVESGGQVDRPQIRVSRVHVQALVPRTTFKLNNSVLFSHRIGNDKPKTVTHSLIFNQTLAFIDSGQNVQQSLVFQQAFNNPFPIQLAIASSLRFSQAFSISPKTFDVAHNLEFKQRINTGSVNLSATQSLLFSHTLTKVQILASAISQTVTQSLRFSQSLVRDFRLLAASNSLLFAQVVQREQIREIIQSVLFSQTVAPNKVLPRAFTQTLRFAHSMLPDLGKIDTKKYSPTIGGGTLPGLTPPPATSPLTKQQHLNTATTIQLFFPISDTPPQPTPTDVITLPRPQLGDRDRLEIERIFRESRGGTLEVKRKTIEQTVLGWTIQRVKESTAQAFLSFVQTTLGKPIGVLDWEGRKWKGFLLTPDSAVIRNRRDLNDLELEIIIEGILPE